VSGSERSSVSLIFTVLNEVKSIDDLLDSIARQTRTPDEIVVVDGGSTDGTVERLRAWNVASQAGLSVIVAPGVSISQGRNIALRAAKGDIVAVTDAGVRLDPYWLQYLADTLESDKSVDVAAGFFRPAPESIFELALAVTTLPDACEVDPARFLPSSRSLAFRRSWFEAGLQYPSWLDYCEDLVFDLRLKRAGARFAFVPEAIVEYQPRSSPRAHWRQYRNYARGDGKSGLFLKRHAIRYASYALLAASLLARRRSSLALVSVGGALYLRKPWQRLWRRRKIYRRSELLAAWLLTPLVRLLGDIAKMTSYPAGLLWRRRRYGPRRSWKSIPDNDC